MGYPKYGWIWNDICLSDFIPFIIITYGATKKSTRMDTLSSYSEYKKKEKNDSTSQNATVKRKKEEEEEKFMIAKQETKIIIMIVCIHARNNWLGDASSFFFFFFFFVFFFRSISNFKPIRFLIVPINFINKEQCPSLVSYHLHFYFYVFILNLFKIHFMNIRFSSSELDTFDQ
jgi:hypothetical protein